MYIIMIIMIIIIIIIIIILPSCKVLNYVFERGTFFV